MTHMPKHLTKGPYFITLDSRYNVSANRDPILRDLRANGPLALVGSVEAKANDASDNGALGQVRITQARKNHLNWHWFGEAGRVVATDPLGNINDASNWPRGNVDPLPPGDTTQTGWWFNWKGEAENIMRCTLIRALEVAMGLTHNCPHHTPGVAVTAAANPANRLHDWPIDFYWVCGVTRFEGYVSWNSAQVTVHFLTPGFEYSIEEYEADGAANLDQWAISQTAGTIFVGQHTNCAELRYTEMAPGVITHNLDVRRGGSGVWLKAQKPQRGCP